MHLSLKDTVPLLAVQELWFTDSLVKPSQPYGLAFFPDAYVAKEFVNFMTNKHQARLEQINANMPDKQQFVMYGIVSSSETYATDHMNGASSEHKATSHHDLLEHYVHVHNGADETFGWFLDTDTTAAEFVADFKSNMYDVEEASNNFDFHGRYLGGEGFYSNDGVSTRNYVAKRPSRFASASAPVTQPVATTSYKTRKSAPTGRHR